MNKNNFLVLLVVYLVFNSSFAFALNYQINSSVNNNDLQDNSNLSDNSFSPSTIFFAEEETEELINNFSCSTESLSDEEVEAFQRELLEKGFTAEELSAGTDPVKDRRILENNTALLVSPDSNEAQKIELPNKEITPNEISYLLNNRYVGAYSLGLLLNDSLRVGQCRNEEENCPLMGNNLTLRTDGEGFKEDFVSIWKDLKGIFSDKEIGEELPDETKQILEDYYNSEDQDELAGQIIKKIPGEYMPNSILVDEFTASMGTTCRDSSCMISLYSFFDKHFNQWFSANMVIQTGAPTLWGGAKKLFGLSSRRGLLGRSLLPDIENSKFVENMRLKFFGHDSFWGNKLGGRISAQKEKFDGFSNFHADFVEAVIDTKGMASSGDSSIVIAKYMDPRTSPLFTNGKIPIENKKEFVKYAKDLKRFTTTSDIYAQRAKKELQERIALVGHDTPAGRAARAEYGGKMARLLGHYDDELNADLPHLFAKAKRSGLWYYALRNLDEGSYNNIRTFPDHFNNVIKAFGGHPKYEFAGKTVRDYRPGTFANWSRYETAGDGLVLYRVKAGRPYGHIEPEELKHMVAKGETTELFAKMEGEGYLPVEEGSIDMILERSPPGPINLYTGGWVKDRVLEPWEMGDKLSGWATNRVQKTHMMSNQLWTSLRERNWAERKYFNAMDKVFANEERLANAYFRTVGGAAKYTAVPYVYWQAKRGFGVEELSAYMLPETWRTVNYSSGNEKLYDDSFIDFFANAGSDQGDLFSRVIDNMPWKYVLNVVSDKFNPVKEQYDRLTKPDGGLRTKVGNIAIYSNTSENCVNCGITLNSQSKNDFSAFFKSSNKTSSIVLEDTPKDEMENGATLINYAHHMDLKGQSPEGEPKDIKLAESIKEKLTCEDAIERVGYGVGFANEYGINPGNYLALVESAGYLAFGMGGAIGSAIQQFVVAAELQDCIDTTEGYYTHFFVPAVKEKESPKEDTVEYSTQKVANIIDNASAQMEEVLTGTGTITKDAVSNISRELDSLSGGAKSSDLVQATFDSFGFSRGMLTGIRLFYFWAEGGTQIDPAEYKTEGKTVMKGTNGQEVVSDNEKGKLIVDGKEILTSEDNVRMASTDLSIPAVEYPNDLTKVTLSGNPNELIFELKLSASGETADLIITDSGLLNCIKDGVKKQTGLPLNSNNLSEAFGKFRELKTTSHPSVFVQKGQIIAEGVPRKVAFNNPSLEVYADRSVKLLNSKDNDPEIGLVKAIYFDNGFILYKKSTNQLIFWLKHHENGKLEQNDVFGLKVNPKTEINSVTGCEEYAFDLSVLGDSESPLKQEKAKLFNKSLDKMGPFNIFKTDKKTYVFYEDKDCIKRMKIINNETGEIIYDDAIDSLTSTTDGFEVKTSDGQTHDFGFSTENGRPFLDYNGIKELLRTVNGKNGSLWYDPEKGMWYSENAQLLPLLDLFRQQGIKTTVDSEGNVKSIPGQNLMNININDKTANNPFNLPSMPEGIALLLFVLGLVSFMLFVQFNFKKN